ncbi:type I-E CRISPR-associated protein Cse2/CasB [Streptomyces mutabilis]|uniref:type I-E CRISPR-associated protein Cse2/CasB n=1 Tax=Streptomyces mutabilis TaxID=67332 RepID=UPI0022BA4075|nr:type I-E CRISPR-associated protein Cse2/CasB [Streptomyces mutabilis]MCZ9348693.1 type I-E CRISPR-associated protein Cse2/CasB [Streptomyces mutabilis]
MTDSVPAASASPASSALRSSDRFVAYVHQLCASTQARAALRRGLGLPVQQCTHLHRYLVPWLRDHDDPHQGDIRRAHYAVASLIAARPRSARDTAPGLHTPGPWYERPNLGASLGQAVAQGVMKENSAESALHLMARQSSDAVHPYLPALTRQLVAGGIPVDWAVLLEDLAWFNRSRDRIATRWLESYFRTATPTTDPADSTEETTR